MSRWTLVANGASERRFFSLSVSFWLFALAVVPLVGASWFAFAEVQQVADSSRQAERVSELTEEFLDFTELRAQLLDESTWS